MGTSNGNRPVLVVNPAEGLVDQPLSVQIRGIAPGREVTLRATARPRGGDTAWTSWATFVAGPDGAVDLAHQAPIAGSYAGVDRNGLLWSLRPASDAGQRTIADGITPVELQLAAEVEGATVAAASVVRRAVAPQVTIRPIREAGIVANIFLPPGDGPFPTIVVVGGSGGGFADGSAALYASHGYAALSLAYFGVPGLPDELLNIPLEYFESALAWLRTQPVFDTERLAISGTSRGGELALLLASRYPAFQAVVAYVPSGFVWGAISRRPDDETPDASPSWTYRGQGLSYVARIGNGAVPPDADNVLTLAPAYLRALDDEARATAATIPVERIAGPILLISGRDDALWPSAVFSDLIVARLAQSGFAHPYHHLSYDGAGHAIGPRYAPTTITRSYHSVRKIFINLGGTPEANAIARDDSWPRVLAFLDEHVKSPSQVKERELASAATG
jgi:dienelactone hydrolase